MADGYIDLSPIMNAIRTVNDNIGRVNSNVCQVQEDLVAVRNETMEEINRVKAQLEDMMHQQKMQAALQRAITEIIRVRQELERDFGTQKLVRTNMLGILQATDLGLITESTISRCTEELMISAPKYWLAPCLIALAAWISNNESLAKRAITEACKRDREKTCLLFALITRRVNAGRIQEGKKASNISFEWLNEYFKLQDPRKMRTSIVAYIDAYTNGIFGEDRENICQEQIYHWMDVLKGSDPAFVQKQEDYWKRIFNKLSEYIDMNGYKELQRVCPQYNQIADYVVRIDASENKDGIKSYIGNIMETPVDTEKLINDIDIQLEKLVGEYEENEQALRDEEKLLSLIKEYEGDEDRAKSDIRAEKERNYDAPVDFAKRLSDSIFDNVSTASAKKTALILLRPYISTAYNDFIIAHKDAYPSEIDLQIRDNGTQITSSLGAGVIAQQKALAWGGKTQNAENREELVASLGAEFDKARAASLATITDDLAKKTKKTGIILSCTILLAVVGIPKILKAKKMVKENEEARQQVNSYYAKAKAESVALLNKALDQRVQANSVVDGFLADPSNETIKL